MQLQKPKQGDACNGCGYCCSVELCTLAEHLLGPDVPAPCPAIEFDNGRFFCGFVQSAEKTSPVQFAMLKSKLGIGVGCDASDAIDTEGI